MFQDVTSTLANDTFALIELLLDGDSYLNASGLNIWPNNSAYFSLSSHSFEPRQPLGNPYSNQYASAAIANFNWSQSKPLIFSTNTIQYITIRGIIFIYEHGYYRLIVKADHDFILRLNGVITLQRLQPTGTNVSLYSAARYFIAGNHRIDVVAILFNSSTRFQIFAERFAFYSPAIGFSSFDSSYTTCEDLLTAFTTVQILSNTTYSWLYQPYPDPTSLLPLISIDVMVGRNFSYNNSGILGHQIDPRVSSIDFLASPSLASIIFGTLASSAHLAIGNCSEITVGSHSTTIELVQYCSALELFCDMRPGAVCTFSAGPGLSGQCYTQN